MMTDGTRRDRGLVVSFAGLCGIVRLYFAVCWDIYSCVTRLCARPLFLFGRVALDSSNDFEMFFSHI